MSAAQDHAKFQCMVDLILDEETITIEDAAARVGLNIETARSMWAELSDNQAGADKS